MLFSETYDSIAYLHDYYPVRYSQHKGVSEQILAFKNGEDDAVKQFALEIVDAKKNMDDEDDTPNISCNCS